MKRKRTLAEISEHMRWVTVPVHLLFFVSFVIPVESTYYAYGVLVWAILSGLGIAIGYHRLLSHRAFEASTWMRRLLAYFGALGGQGSPIFWVSTHRSLHHRYSDQAKDPHSPKHGRFHAFIGWQIWFSRHDFNPKYAIDLLGDPFMRLISQYYYLVYWTSFALVFFVHRDFALTALLPAMIMAIHQENIVNCLCHQRSLGYRCFETRDDSVNIWILGVLFWGQAFHNNHHADPKAFDFGTRWYEFDACRWIVPLLRTDRRDQLRPAAEPALEVSRSQT